MIRAGIPVLPASFPPLVWPPTASRRHFCARGQQGRGEAKTQNRRKGYLRPRKAILSSGSVPIFPTHKTPHRGRQRPAQGIKQPRPTPSGASRGIVICCGPGRGRRSGPFLHPTRRSRGLGIAYTDTPSHGPTLSQFGSRNKPKSGDIFVS